MTTSVFDKSRSALARAGGKITNAPPTRRAMLLGAAATGAAGIAVLTSSDQTSVSTVAGRLDPRQAQDLGDGFYLVDGWVMTAADLGL
ncbi:MAG: hypothetical protein AAF224_10885 [Pseudomonadota bacterium]